MPPRVNENRRNNALQIIVNKHRNDPEFLARLISTGIKGPVKNTAANYLRRLRNRAATNVRTRLTRNTGAMMYIFNAPGVGRKNRSLLRSAIALPNTSENQRRVLTNIQNYMNQEIKPHINRLRLSQNRTHYRHPNRPGAFYILENNGRLISRGILNYLLASGVRRKRGGRLNY